MTDSLDYPFGLDHSLDSSCDEYLARDFPEFLFIRSPTYFEWRCRQCSASRVVERARTTHERENAGLLAHRRAHRR